MLTFLPLLFLISGVVVLVYGLVKKSQPIKKWGLILIAIAIIAAIPILIFTVPLLFGYN